MTSKHPPSLHTVPPLASGAAMDRVVPPPHRGLAMKLARAGLALLAVGMVAVLVAKLREPALRKVETPQLAAVEAGEFRDELPLRARVEPLRSVQLDATEAGRVEAVLVRDGEVVQAGVPLYRLHSPEQEQLLMQRSAEVAQQMANASVQRSALASSLAQNRRELLQLQAAAQQAEAELKRQNELAASGFITQSALEQVQRQQRLARELLVQAREDQRLEAETRAQSQAEMDSAVRRLQGGLKLIEKAQQRLLQRAPIAGQLSGFSLQVGASVRPGDRLGRIDDAEGGLQLAAEVDEYYLPRLRTGLAATTEGRGRLQLAQTLPQVQGGKVRVLLRWNGEAAPVGLRAGQAVELRLQLSEATAQALVLPDGPGVQSRLYVREGSELRLREVHLGRRAAGRVEVLSGLKAGDQVLISQPPPDAQERLALP
ncbi:HlyD family efflux transporter periplasmic adaptor subunit [Pelomonas sp. SE-A7]|uniref:efflux RND transporter periplasmic adaptor subunit n=1 Tax=Pelomonas sp. SE-A7 TaxID=3054953 RepID=UPI00259D172B|nr:HlyD family efflux transporter periplasmic adaptor subunit [Pelomonas sp. SE-A7]MDM4766546.1 hypothetical protein [Pelomonas sp. SE-A7]